MQKSLLGKLWQYPDIEQEDFMNLYLQNNGIKDHNKYFDKKYPDSLHDENLLPDIKIAINRIIKAIEDQEKIIIFGDYDCDGIPGTAICVETLRDLGAQVSYRIPDREIDGYGLKNYFLDEISNSGASLIITVDNGISAINEVKYANKLGMDIIISDHHEVGENLPEACAVVNPLRMDSDYPFESISGACVAWKLMIGLAKKIKGEAYANLNVRDKFIDLVALSTVTDIMPLRDENRVIVSKGLEAIKNTNNQGILEIFKELKVDNKTTFDSDFFGFALGPRINAAGRMASPYYALQLLLGKKKFASVLEKLNKTRKKQVEIALDQVENSDIDLNNIVILNSTEWKSGIIGLIAGKITEKHNTPSIILQEKNGNFVGSCRAPVGFNIYEFLSQFNKYFSHFGGHAQACGFSMKKGNFDQFKKLVLEKGLKSLSSTPIVNNLELSYLLNESELSMDFIIELIKFEPFGHGNRKPIFLIKNIKNDFSLVGQDKSHITLKFWGQRAIGFGFGKFEDKLRENKHIDLAVTLGTQVWNGKKQINIQIQDIMLS